MQLEMPIIGIDYILNVMILSFSPICKKFKIIFLEIYGGYVNEF